jgi:hypothetical protein
MALSAFPSARNAAISRIASCSASCGTSSPASRDGTRKGPAAEIPTARLLVSFNLADTLADAVALGLSEGGGDREEQLRQTI